MVRTVAEAREQVKRRVIIAGEMMELGPDAPAMHREVGREIAKLGVDILWGVRGLASEIVAGAPGSWIARQRAFLQSSDEAAAAIVDEVREGDLVLVKGSRSVETDKVVKALKARFPLADER